MAAAVWLRFRNRRRWRSGSSDSWAWQLAHARPESVALLIENTDIESPNSGEHCTRDSHRLFGHARAAGFLFHQPPLPIFVLRVADAEREHRFRQRVVAARAHANKHDAVGARFNRANVGRWSLRVGNHALSGRIVGRRL